MVAAGSLRLSAQIRIGPQEDYHLGPYAGKTPDSLSLKGADARLSFLQQSDDLVHWTDCVLIAADANRVIRCDLTPTAPTGFVRLEDATAPRTNQADDFDGDGISDAEEWRQGTDPFSAALDTNGLPLDWEKYYGVPPGVDPNAVSPRTDGLSYLQAFQEGIDPVGYHADLLPTLTMSGDRQTGPPGGFVPAPLVVLATDLDGEPMVDVPIRFQVDTGLLQASSSASPAGTIFARTDAEGNARAFLPVAPTSGARPPGSPPRRRSTAGVCPSSSPSTVTTGRAPTFLRSRRRSWACKATPTAAWT